MVKIVNGNLLNATEDIICHQVNCQGAMNSGIAKQIRERWPEVYEEYKNYCDRNGVRFLMGSAQVIITNDFHTIANLFAQNLYGYDGRRFTSYDAFYKCLEWLRDNTYSDRSIAFPYKIGSDRGGASWDVIYAMICDVLGDREVTIYKLED